MSLQSMYNATAVIMKASGSKVEGVNKSAFTVQPGIPVLFNTLSGMRVYVNKTTSHTVVAECRVDAGTDVAITDRIAVNGREWIIDDIDNPGLKGWMKVLKLANVT